MSAQDDSIDVDFVTTQLQLRIDKGTCKGGGSMAAGGGGCSQIKQ